MVIYLAVLALILSYLAGSIPSAVWAGRMFHGIDIREHGSGNAGATNTVRVLGWKTGIPVLVFDLAKGWLAASLPVFLSAAPEGSPQMTALKIACGLAAIIGHVFPLFAGFRGGKGVATTFGVLLALHPLLTLYMCRDIPCGAADKQLCITKFNDCRSNVPGTVHDRFPDSLAPA